MLLAIDTATSLAGIALHDTRGPRGAIRWRTERNHTVELLPHIVRLLAEAGGNTHDLQVIAVAIGPGSYTGLRIGLSVAKGFCLAHGAALVGVPTLDISARAYPVCGAELCALLQAGRGRLAARFYQAVQGTWQAGAEDFFGRAEELATACAGRTVFFAGEIDPATERALGERLGQHASFAPEGERSRDPGVLALLGWQRWKDGDAEDVETLVPVYGQ